MKKLSKKDKILYSVYKMSLTKNRKLRYEDILVKVFEMFPEDFQIRYYPKYPDTDTIRRALYQLIPEGLIRISFRNCALTVEGRERGAKLVEFIDGESIFIDGRRDINQMFEIKRMLALQGFNMYLDGTYSKIIDQDFYEFYKSSVRTKNLELSGKLKQVNELIQKYIEEKGSKALQLFEYSEFLKKKFEYLIRVE